MAGEAGPRLLLPEGGLSDVELRDALQPYEHVALLRVSMLEAGQVRRVACAWPVHGLCMACAPIALTFSTASWSLISKAGNMDSDGM